MSKPRVYMVSQPYYLEPFADLMEVTDVLYYADVVFFTGGADVDPSLYGENKGRLTGSNIARDQREAILFASAQDYGIPSLGICRGSQFLTVMAGGKLVQHTNNHGRNHEVFTNRKMTVVLSSTHHQMMNPFGLDKDKYELIGWAEGLSDTYLDGNNKEIPTFIKERIEPEIVYYKETKSLCIQAHPEIMPRNSKGVELCRELLKEYLL